MVYGFWWLFLGFGIASIICLALALVCYFVFGNEISALFFGGTFLVLFGVALISLFIAIFNPINAKAEVMRYENMYTSYQSYADLLSEQGTLDGNFTQNGKYMQEIVEYNTWVANAIANKEAYGCFSRYYNVDLSGLQLVVLGD